MKKKEMSWKKLLVFISVFLYSMAGMALAAEPGAIVGSSIDGEQIVLYVQGAGTAGEVQCQVGTTPCPDSTIGLITEQEVPVKTLLLIDNSLSVQQKYRPMINEIMNNLAANRIPGEQIAVATFSDKITYLLEGSSDYAQLKQAIDSITYQDQETYLTDVLYEVLSAWNQDGDPTLRRIVIVSDGVDNKAIGYTKEELYELLRKHPYPIYTIGCTSGSDSADALKNMFALSRMTQSESWLLDEVTDSMAVANGVAQGNLLWRITVSLPPELCDGTEKAVKLSITAEGQVLEGTTTIGMPFSTIQPTEAETEPETVTEPETSRETEEETEPEEEDLEEDTQKKKIVMYLIFGGFGLLIIGAVIILIVRRTGKNKKSNDFEMAPDHAYRDVSALQGFAGSAVTPAAQKSSGLAREDSNNTAMVWGSSQRSYMLVLTDLNNPVRTFEAPLRTSVVIGRSRSGGCQIILDYDRSVSHKHCQIQVVNGQIRVTDLGSRNGTLVNGKRVIQEAVLNSGSILTLGNLKMKVELR
ncbi:MAG: FHA domain-containing protein [Lachnospiraceae bacterium]|nr:FHA domain-containing protein [Lachnospiraceae bacterium]